MGNSESSGQQSRLKQVLRAGPAVPGQILVPYNSGAVQPPMSGGCVHGGINHDVYILLTRAVPPVSHPGAQQWREVA